jgi:hypothetical protein
MQIRIILSVKGFRIMNYYTAADGLKMWHEWRRGESFIELD